MPDFNLGDRVQLSELGKSRNTKARPEKGTVVRVPRRPGGPKSVDVLFDGNKQATTIHLSYIEKESC